MQKMLVRVSLFLLQVYAIVALKRPPNMGASNGASTSGIICSNKTGLFYFGGTDCVAKTGLKPVAVALAKNDINSTGWAYLEVKTFPGDTDDTQAYSAGFLEGMLTSELIFWHYYNTVAGYCDGAGSGYCDRLKSFLQKNIEWMMSQIASKPTDPYWHQVKLILTQLTGLHDGFYGRVRKPWISQNINFAGFLLFQLGGDLEDLEALLQKPKTSGDRMWGVKRHVIGSGSCSALVKPVAHNSDLLVSHDTWSFYQSMLRIQKLYNFAFKLSQDRDVTIPGKIVTFSGYPGTLPSIDDFYLTSAGLTVTETTIGNDNKTLFRYIKPVGSVFTWIRSQVANRLARNGNDWTSIFTKFNSGTYNNQWMIVDYKNFKPKQPLPKKGLFYVLEQLPGTIISRDMSSFLAKRGYWPSYNVPFFPEIFNLSGGWQNVEKYGDWFTYDRTPRALIFKRDQHNVFDMKSLQHLMRSNDYEHDPMSRCNCTPPYSAENAIAARCDLNPSNGTYPFGSLGHRSHGATDMKATSWALFRKFQFVGISSPTFQSLPPFQWSKSHYNSKVPHHHQPDKWDFGPVIHKWRLIS